MGEIEQKVAKDYVQKLELYKNKLRGINKKIRIMEKERIKMEKQIENLDKFLNETVKSGIEVSDHAIVRYFERVLGYDFDRIKNDILTKEIIDNYEKLGDGTYQNGNFSLVIQNRKVVTVK